MKELWNLFVTFAKIGGFTFGGGYAMLPVLQREIVENKHWATEEELMDYYAIGQCTPGIIAINTATFIGYKYQGIIGGIIATLGCIAPSLVIITIIAAFLQNFASFPVVQHALNGICVCVTVLIFNAVIRLGRKSLFRKEKPNPLAVSIAVFVFAAALFTDISTVFLIIISGIICVAIRKMEEAKA